VAVAHFWLWQIVLKKSPYRDGQNFGASLMRLALGDATDHVDSARKQQEGFLLNLKRLA